ncbi:pyridoxal phosphate-dependent transferase [Trametes elegans]|nr:pyridoxal phosphate-dependent transferase [Trametes elegans]
MSAPSFVDLTHHLSPETLQRRSNPLKDIIRIALSNPELVSLANGDPHHTLYPIRRIDYEVASVASEDPVADWRSLGAAAPSQVLSTAQDEDNRLLRAALQYGHGAGLAATLKTVDEINKAYHTAPHHVPIMTLGNADGITKVFRLFGAPGDHFLADEFTFAPMPIAAEAHDVKWVPVSIDTGGIIPEELERILATWDPARGRRPHVLYTVPCGQNPTGSTLSLERREKIYSIAQRYDLIIIEDDPYYFLQYDRTVSGTPSGTHKALPKSFLSMDVDGRVVRIDSFSKIMVPGMRLGWITSTPALHAHLVRLVDLSTQNPHGFGQILVAALLGAHGWGLGGFAKWVGSLRADYQRRRDFFLSAFAREVAPTGLASADVPEAGMFVWIRVHLEQHPRFRADVARARAAEGEGAAVGARTNTTELLAELFEACVAGGLVICPSSVFTLKSDARYRDVPTPIEDRSNFLRATFAGSEETIAAGVPILGRVLREFFGVGDVRVGDQHSEVPRE